MKHQKWKLSIIKWLLPLLVLIISGSILYTVVQAVQEIKLERARTKAELNAVVYADQLKKDLSRGINITKSLELILISEDGKIDKFDTVAEQMMAGYVQSIRFAPGGVVTDNYPAEGNEAGKIDLIHDEKRGEFVNYSMEHHMCIMQGPFDLKQGGQGIAIYNPVYLMEEDEKEYFWGLTSVIIKVPEIFSNSISALTTFDYQYVLSKTSSISGYEYQVIDSSGVELVDPVSHSFKLGGCIWKLEVMPTGGWEQSGHVWLAYLCGGVMILLLEGLIFALLTLEEQRRKFKKLSLTDGLTGLLNRTGYDRQMERYLAGNQKKPCVVMLMDVDNFKFLNDIYGHSVGDQGLCHLARSLEQAFSKNAIIGRNGGDEFCVLLKNCTAAQMTDQIEAFCQQHRSFSYKGKEYHYTISLGYSEYPTHGEKVSDLLRYADMALYEVKLRGKNSSLFYESDFHASKRTQLGFKLNDISLNLPGAFFIYKADRQNEQILYANQEMIQYVGCEDMDDFLHFTDRKFCNLVHPEEYDQVEESIWQQIESTEDNVNVYVKYRLARKDGTYRQVLDFGRIVQSEHYGPVFYVLIMDLDVIREHYGSKGGIG